MKLIVSGLLLLLSPLIVYCQDRFVIQYAAGDKYKITEIANMRKTVNGTYAGLAYKQVRGILEVGAKSGEGTSVSGDFYVFEETKRNSVLIANQIDKIVPVTFTIQPDGKYAISNDTYYPLTRDFPVFPKTPLAPGDTWREYGTRFVEPFGDGTFTRVRFYCEYKYEGEKDHQGKRYKLITAQYALRYKKGDDPKGDPRLAAITNAGHKVEIYFDADKRRPVFMRDLIIENLGGEVYKFSDNTQTVVHGFTQTWFDFIQQLDGEKIVKEIEEEIKVDDIPDVTIEENDKGVTLTLNNIHFVANKETILPEERSRLDSLYDALAKIKGRTFLVVGHTAKSGTESEQYDLSVKRAKAIVDYMIGKGFEPKRFLYEGRGASEPVAPNDNEQNMAKNRRVEITIMED